MKLSTKKILGGLLGLIVTFALVIASFSAPYVELVDISQEDNQVTYNAPFTVHFSHLMNQASVEAGFQIAPKTAGHFEWKNGKVLEFHPDSDLKIGDKYSILIDSEARSLWMKKLGSDYTLDYVVTGPPYVLFVHPNENSVLQDDGIITVMFDRPMALDEVDENDLIKTEPKSKGKIRLFGESAFQYFPENLEVNREYAVLIPEGLLSRDGGEIQDEYEFTVKTPSLSVLNSEPLNDTKELSIEAPLVMKFNQAVPLDQIKPGINALLYPSNDLDAGSQTKNDGFFNTEVTYGVDDEGNKLEDTLIFKPSFPYQNDESYSFILKGVEGLDLKEDFELKFTTKKQDIDGDSETLEIEDELDEDTKSLAWDFDKEPSFIRGEHPRLHLKQALNEPVRLSACQISSNEYIRMSARNELKNYQCESGAASLDKIEAEFDLDDSFDIDWVPGVYFTSLSNEEVKLWTTFIIRDADLLVKTSDKDLLVWASDVKTGEPITDFEIDVLDFDGEIALQGVTDENGIFKSSKKPESIFYVRARKNEDGRTRFGFAPGKWNVSTNSDANEGPSGIYLLSDQHTYSGGDSIKVKGIWRERREHLLTMPESLQIQVMIQDEAGNTLTDKRIALRRNGSFDAELALPENTTAGSYHVVLADLNHQLLGASIPVLVRNNKPEVSLEWTTSESSFSQQSTPVFIAKARYNNGIPAANLTGYYQIYQKPAQIKFQEGPINYHFGKLDSSCQIDCNNKVLLKEEVVNFDIDGESKLLLTNELGGFLEPGYEYTVLLSSDEKPEDASTIKSNFIVRQGALNLGLGLQHSVVALGDSIEFSTLVFDQEMSPLSDKKVRVQLLKSSDEELLYEKVMESKIVPETISIPSRTEIIEGNYVLRAETLDGDKNSIVSERQVYVTAEGGQTIGDDFNMVLDQSKYFVGGRAHIFVNEPDASEDNPVSVMISSERNGLIDYEIVSLKKPITEVTIPITEAMLPYFEVKVSKFHKGVDHHYVVLSDVIEVGNDEGKIFVDINLEPENPKPGDEVLVNLYTYDWQNRPLATVVTLSVIDGLVEKANFNHEFFYQANASRDNLSNEHRSILFDPLLTTDEGGLAKVKFKIPEDAEAVSIQALATKDSAQFGTEELNLLMSHRLSINPILPSSLVPGDQTVFAASVKNISDELINTRVELISPLVAVRGDSARNITLKPGQQTDVSYVVHVDKHADAEEIELSFRSAKDVGKASIPLNHSKSSSSLIEQGIVSDIWSGHINPPKDAFLNLGELRLNLGGHPINMANVYREYRKNYDLDSNFAVVADLILAKFQISKDDGESSNPQVGLVSELLKTMEVNGSFRHWTGAPSSPVLSAYAALAFHQAMENGINVDSTKLNLLYRYLWNSLEDTETQNKAFILWTLGLHGNYDTERSLALFKEREDISLAERGFLLMNLNQLVEAGQKSAALFLDRLKAEIVDEVQKKEALLSTEFEVEELAVVLYSLNTLKAEGDILTPLVKIILQHKTDLLTKFNLEEALWIILSLSETEAGSQSGTSYITKAKLNGDLILDKSITPQSIKEEISVVIPAKNLREVGVNELLVIKEGSGDLYFDAQLVSYLNPELLSPVEEGLVVIRQYFERLEDGQLEAVSEMKKGVTYVSRLELIVPQDLEYVEIKENLPVGARAQGSAFSKLAPHFVERQIKGSQVLYYASKLPAGVYQIDTLLEAQIPGEYRVLPAKVSSLFNASVSGQTAGGLLQISE